LRPKLVATAAGVVVRAAALLCVSLAGAGAVRADILFWPASDGDWNPMLSGGSFYSDPVGDINPDWLDVVGDSSFASGYWAFSDAGTGGDSSDDELMFRIRLEEAPNNANVVWQVFMDVDLDGLVDFSLQVDESGDNAVELVPALVGGTTFSEVSLDTVAPWSGSIAGFSRFVVPTGDGSTFGGGGDDAFLDLGIPWDDFSALTGASGSDPIRFGLSSSASHSLINKDLPFSLSGSDPVAAGFADAVVGIPEPATATLLGTGLLLLSAWRRSRR
jgi:hypothetical protein